MGNAFWIEMMDGSEVKWSGLSHKQSVCLNELVDAHVDFRIVKSFGWYKDDTSPPKMDPKHFGYITGAIKTGEFNCIHTHCDGNLTMEISGGITLNQNGS